jgi:diguanylate cyclase (GGDEF)-like protein/PAS domain S-box-containing protein
LQTDIKNREEFWLKQLLESPHIGILVTDRERNVVFVNKHLCKRIGYEADELIGKSSRIFHISDKSYEEFFQKVLALVEADEPVSIDYPVRHKDGKELWITISGTLSESKNEVLWSIVDITKKVEKEREIKQLKERMEIALLGHNSGVWEWNVTTNEVYFSDEWKRLFGYELNQGEDNFDMWALKVHPDDKERVFTYISNSLEKKLKQFEIVYRFENQAGEWMWILSRGLVFYNENEGIRIVGIHTDITSQKTIEEELSVQKEKLRYLAHHDVLTQLPNRLYFNEKLEILLKREKKRTNIAILFLDLDYFKDINDTYGHDVGDEVLKIVTKRFLKNIRKEDTLARFGGDEFAIILENMKRKSHIEKLAQKLIDIFKDPITIEEDTFTLSCSIGISCSSDEVRDVQQLLKYADIAMYKAKEAGKNRYIFYK